MNGIKRGILVFLIFLVAVNSCFAKDNKDYLTRALFAQMVYDLMSALPDFQDIPASEYQNWLDVPKSHPNYKAINYLWARSGIYLPAIEYINFKPNYIMWRFEFAIFLEPVVAKIEQKYQISFADGKVAKFLDIPEQHWGHDAVTSLHSKGILNGYPGDKFRGKQPILISEAKRCFEIIKTKISDALLEKSVGKINVKTP